jgi:hypothetical protein
MSVTFDDELWSAVGATWDSRLHRVKRLAKTVNRSQQA